MIIGHQFKYDNDHYQLLSENYYYQYLLFIYISGDNVSRIIMINNCWLYHYCTIILMVSRINDHDFRSANHQRHHPQKLNLRISDLTCTFLAWPEAWGDVLCDFCSLEGCVSMSWWDMQSNALKMRFMIPWPLVSLGICSDSSCQVGRHCRISSAEVFYIFFCLVGLLNAPWQFNNLWGWDNWDNKWQYTWYRHLVRDRFPMLGACGQPLSIQSCRDIRWSEALEAIDERQVCQDDRWPIDHATWGFSQLLTAKSWSIFMVGCHYAV